VPEFKTQVAIFCCQDPEEAWFQSLAAQCEAEYEAHERERGRVRRAGLGVCVLRCGAQRRARIIAHAVPVGWLGR